MQNTYYVFIATVLSLLSLTNKWRLTKGSNPRPIYQSQAFEISRGESWDPKTNPRMQIYSIFSDNLKKLTFYSN